MNGLKASIVVLVIAITAAAAAFVVRGRPGIARVEVAADSPSTGSPRLLVEPDALYRAVRIARGVEGHGWVGSREDGLGPAVRPEGAAPPEEDFGAPIPWAPGYDLALAAIHRRALPSFAQLIADEEQRVPAPAPELDERVRIERLVAGTPPVLAGLTALLAALLAALLTPGAGASAAAAVAGLGVAFGTVHVEATARGAGSAAGWTGLLVAGALFVTVRAWMQPRINQPFWSSLRGGVAGLLAGLAVASDPGALAPVMLLQLAFFARLLVPFVDADGRPVPARSFPVFVTSFHKVALLVLLPATVENPFVTGDPMGVVGVTWLPLAMLGIGWLAFAPFALVPRLVGRRPVVALVPAALLAAAVLLGTSASARLVELAGSLAGPHPHGLVWLGLVPLAVIAGAGTLRRRPELVPVVLVGGGLFLLAFLDGVDPALSAAPVSVLLAALLVPLALRRFAGRPTWVMALALAAIMVASGGHPGTLSPDVDAGGQRAARPNGGTLQALLSMVETRPGPQWVHNDPSLGPFILWHSAVAPSSVAVGGSRSSRVVLTREPAGLEGEADVVRDRARLAGYPYALNLLRSEDAQTEIEFIDLTR